MTAHRGMMALGSLTVFQRLVIAVFFAWTLSLGQALAQAAQLPLGEQCFSALAPTSGGTGGTGTGYIGLLGTITGGTGGTAGTYSTALTGGSGSGAQANITVSGGTVTAVAVYNPGVGYVVGDTLSATAGNIGGVTGFSVPVSSVAVNQALAGGSVGYYIPSTLTTKTTWKDSGEVTANTNPITLDANGCAIVYGNGTYRQILKDSLGNIVWDQVTTAGQITNAQLAPMLANSVKCNPTSSTAAPQDCQIGMSLNVESTNVPGLDGAQWFIYDAPTTPSTNGVATLRVDRDPTYTGGTPGQVYKGIWGVCSPSAGVANYEWCILGQLTNSATGGQNVAGYFQGLKATSGAGPTWGMVAEVSENSAGSSSGTIGAEIDLVGSGASNASNRVMLDLVGFTQSGGTEPTIGNGIRIGPASGNPANAQWTNGIMLNTGNYVNGINLANGTYSSFAFESPGFNIDGSGNVGVGVGKTITLNATTSVDGTFAGGSTTPVLTANKPGSGTAIGTWLKVLINGNTYWVPAWAN